MGKAHPDYLLAELDLPQLADWKRFYARRPFGSYRDDLRQFVLLKYFMASQGGGGDLPSTIYPYFASDEELAEMLEAYQRADAEIEE